MIEIHDNVFKEELAKIPPLTRETYFLTDAIASKIESVMVKKGCAWGKDYPSGSIK